MAPSRDLTQATERRTTQPIARQQRERNSMLRLQRMIGNRAVANVVAARAPSRMLSRAPGDTNFIIDERAMQQIEDKLRELYDALPRAERIALKAEGTVAVGMVTAKGDLNNPRLVYTTASNSASTNFQAAAERVGLFRWEGQVGSFADAPAGARLPPGQGGVGHAEQLMIGYAKDHGYVVHGMAVSRQFCHDCPLVIREHKGGRIMVSVIPDPDKTLPNPRRDSWEAKQTRKLPPESKAPTPTRADPTSGPPPGYPARKGPNFKPQPHDAPYKPRTPATPATPVKKPAGGQAPVSGEIHAPQRGSIVKGGVTTPATTATGELLNAEGALTKGGGRVGTAIGKIGTAAGWVADFLMPGPLDAIMLLVQYASAYDENRARAKQRGWHRGFIEGVASRLIFAGQARTFARNNLVPQSVAVTVLSEVAGTTGSWERGYVSGLGDGIRLGDAMSVDQRTALRKYGAKGLRAQHYHWNDDSWYSRQTVSALADSLSKALDEMLEQAEDARFKRNNLAMVIADQDVTHYAEHMKVPSDR